MTNPWYAVFLDGPNPVAMFQYEDLAKDFINRCYAHVKEARAVAVAAPVLEQITLAECPQCKGLGKVQTQGSAPTTATTSGVVPATPANESTTPAPPGATGSDRKQ